jgi:hypothetical protein
MQLKSTLSFEGVCEWDDKFLALFPHRFDYIWAEHPTPAAVVEWKTESRHPLSDRLIQQGAYLYGVRFAAETRYCLLDIDAGSLYHPNHDPLALSRITAALEPLGLVRSIPCTSSYSNGLHLYFPFQNPQSSWQLAIVLACLLENAGFKLQPGQLEVFPNPKPYATDGHLSLFNAHRLPLQLGSYLLNPALQPIWSDPSIFVRQWQLAQQHNDIDSPTLKQTLKQAKRKHFGISGKAEKFVNDLNAEIELGWTGAGQTNRLLGRITMRAYIFHHILSGSAPLEGQALVNEIVTTARSLPGYFEWCRHQHELEHRAQEWARCIESSHYFHFGDQLQKPKPALQDPELTAAIDQAPSWNQQRSAATRDRIRSAIAHLLETNSLPFRATARFQALLKYNIGGASLYRHRDLWHPNHLGVDLIENWADHLGSTADDQLINRNQHRVRANNPGDYRQEYTSLLDSSDGNNPAGKDHSDLTGYIAVSNDGNDSSGEAAVSRTAEAQSVLHARAQWEVLQEATWLAQSQQHRIQAEAGLQRQVARMQRFLDSGDPILVAEAMAWAQVNPGVLNMSPSQRSLLADSSRLPLDEHHGSGKRREGA